jgi:hypothetical protein
MDFRGLAEAVAEVPPPPCEVYRCRYYAKCATELLACKAFQYYVYTGLAVAPHSLPSRRKYDVVMRGYEHSQVRSGNKVTEVRSV